MYHKLHQILADRSDGLLFRCFDPWHMGYITLFILLALLLIFNLRERDSKTRTKTTQGFIDLAFGLYIADFFLMPLAYGEIDIEKLPFHICTAMCVMCFLSRRIDRLKPYAVTFTSLAFLSNLGYLIYPAGLMWHQTHPLSYRVLQTLGFHGLMSVYGLLVLVYEATFDNLKFWRRDLLTVICMVLWALLGNYCYNNERFYNWFFVVRDPFYLLPAEIAKYCMPVFNIILFFSSQMLIYGIIYRAKRPPAS